MSIPQHSESVRQTDKPAVVAFRCPRALKKALHQRALDEDTTVGAVLVDLLRREFGSTAA